MEKKDETVTKAKRRNNGEGHIRQRKDGRWEAIIYDNRTAKHVSVYAKTEAEVKKKLREKKKDLVLKLTRGCNDRLEEYAFKYMKNYRYNQVKQTTYDKQEQMLKLFIIPKIGYLKLNEIKTDDLQQIYNEMTHTYSYSTIKKVNEVIKLLFKHATLVGDINLNPALAVKMPREESLVKKTKEIQIYSDEDLNILEKFIFEIYDKKNKYRFSPAYILLANTGIRRGEILAVKLSDIDLHNKILNVSKSLTRYQARDQNKENLHKSIVEITMPKTKSSIRTVPLNKKSILMIEELIRRNKLEGIDSEYLICAKDGSFLSSRSFDQMLERVCSQSDVKFLGLHALRHSFASKCFRAGIDVLTISKILGHANTKITEQTYIHLMETQKINAVEKLDNF